MRNQAVLPSCSLLVPSACHSRFSPALAAVANQGHSREFTRPGPAWTGTLDASAGRLDARKVFERSGRLGLAHWLLSGPSTRTEAGRQPVPMSEAARRSSGDRRAAGTMPHRRRLARRGTSFLTVDGDGHLRLSLSATRAVRIIRPSGPRRRDSSPPIRAES